MCECSGVQVESIHQGRVVAQYREMARWSQQKLAEMMRVSVHTVQRMEKEVVIKDLNRRRFLVALLGIPATLMGVETEPQEVEQKMLHLNDDPMSFLEEMVTTRWKAHLMGGPMSAANGLERVVQVVEHSARQVQGQAWHARAYAQLYLVYQLYGSVQGDLMRYQPALSFYEQAFIVADELHDQELMAAVRVRQGILFMRRDEPLQAITFFTHAQTLATGLGVPMLRGNILALLSEAHAKARHIQECWRCIGLAERTLEQPLSTRERSHRLLSPALIAAHKGVDALLLRDYDRSVMLIEKSLQTYYPTLTPGRARLLARKAEALCGLHEIDACVVTAEQALTLSTSVGASNTLARLKALHATFQ